MIKEIFRKSIVVILCNILAYAPLLRAEQLSLPSGDLIAPKITQEKYDQTISPGSNHNIKVSVSDNVGVKQVTLYYRIIGSSDYNRRTMERVKKTDRYIVAINANEIKSPGIEYYIQAVDLAGNTLLHGYSFSPISVKLGPEIKIASAKYVPQIKSEDEKESSNKWLWIGLGVLVAAAAASGGGGGGGDTTPTATLTITTAEPIN